MSPTRSPASTCRSTSSRATMPREGLADAGGLEDGTHHTRLLGPTIGRIAPGVIGVRLGSAAGRHRRRLGRRGLVGWPGAGPGPPLQPPQPLALAVSRPGPRGGGRTGWRRGRTARSATWARSGRCPGCDPGSAGSSRNLAPEDHGVEQGEGGAGVRGTLDGAAAQRDDEHQPEQRGERGEVVGVVHVLLVHRRAWRRRARR